MHTHTVFIECATELMCDWVFTVKATGKSGQLVSANMWKWTALMVRGPLTPYTNSPTRTHKQTHTQENLSDCLCLQFIYCITSNHLWFDFIL